MSDEKYKNSERQERTDKPVSIAAQQASRPEDDKKRTDCKISKAKNGICLPIVMPIVIAFFSLVTALATCVYAWCFIESERGFIIIKPPRFVNGEPSIKNMNWLDLSVYIDNIGRHAAIVTNIAICTGIFIVHKDLPGRPNYSNCRRDIVTDPLAPNSQATIYMQENGHNWPISDAEAINRMIAGIYPWRMWGRVRYEGGFISIWQHDVGFCFEYVRPQARIGTNDQFRVCNNWAYVYTE